MLNRYLKSIEKQCARCKEVKLIDEFNTKGTNGSWCRTCHKEYHRNSRREKKKDMFETSDNWWERAWEEQFTEKENNPEKFIGDTQRCNNLLITEQPVTGQW